MQDYFRYKYIQDTYINMCFITVFITVIQQRFLIIQVDYIALPISKYLYIFA